MLAEGRYNPPRNEPGVSIDVMGISLAVDTWLPKWPDWEGDDVV